MLLNQTLFPCDRSFRGAGENETGQAMEESKEWHTATPVDVWHVVKSVSHVLNVAGLRGSTTQPQEDVRARRKRDAAKYERRSAADGCFGENWAPMRP